MNKFSLLVNNWGSWELEDSFATFAVAKVIAHERFPQNEWRIVDRQTGDILIQYDPDQTIVDEAAAEAARFQETARWRQVYADRAAEREAARQRINRMVEVAARQRERQRQRIRERRDRLAGFNFVGQSPEVLDDRFERILSGFYDTADEDWEERDWRGLDAKVNWLKEGF